MKLSIRVCESNSWALFVYDAAIRVMGIKEGDNVLVRTMTGL
ncbi:hypothetical protein ACFL13_01310 [Patescibacteria group bacterium]